MNNITYEEAKTRINNAITTNRSICNVVNISGEFDPHFGIYFIGNEVFIINIGRDIELQELYEEDESLVEKIVLELAAGRFKPNKSFQ